MLLLNNLMSLETNNQLKNVLTLIENLDSSTNFNVYIPSLQKEFKFKQLTTEQLKRLLKTIIDSPIYSTEFILTFNSIIRENCLAQDLDTGVLTVLDKHIILFKMRIESISPEYTFEIDDQNKITVSLTKKLSELLNKQIKFDCETFSNDDYSVTCNLPSLNIENKFEEDLHQNTTFNINSSKDLRDIIGETFVNEVTKFITTLTIKNTPIDLTAYDFKSRVKIIEKLPISLINNVIKYIEKYRALVQLLFTFELTMKDGSVLQQEITQDSSFFNT